jgi:hypothetical protein
MQVVLLEKVVNPGNLGDIVKVKGGNARNLPLHTDVLVDVTVAVDMFAGTVGFWSGIWPQWSSAS